MARLSEPPPRSPFLPPETRAPLPPAEPRLRQRAGAALILAVLSLVTMMFISNLQRAGTVAAVAFAVALVALVLGVSTLSAVKRARARRPRGALAGVILSVAGLLFSGCALIGFLAFGSQIDQYANCMNATSTSAGQHACQTQLEHAIDAQLGVSGKS